MSSRIAACGRLTLHFALQILPVWTQRETLLGGPAGSTTLRHFHWGDQREALGIGLRNGTEVLVDAVNSCSVRPGAEFLEEQFRLECVLGFSVPGFVLRSGTPVAQMHGASGRYLTAFCRSTRPWFWCLGDVRSKERRKKASCINCG